MGIISFTYFAVRSTIHTPKGYTTGQMVLGRDIILLINTYTRLEINTSAEAGTN